MNRKFNRPQKYIFFPLVAIGFVALGAWIVMLLWNAILPGLITGVAKITFLKAAGLLLLIRILLGGLRGRRGGFRNRSRWNERMMHMNEEEREKFKTEWKERCRRK
jgi:hypothetical protein